MLLLNGDCIEQMQKLIDDGVQVDSVVTDPPYHITSIVKRFGKEGSAPARDKDGAFQRQSVGFMGKEWDGGDIAFRKETWELFMKVLKPGGHLLAFFGSRTYHRMAVAIEDAGFNIRDQIMWLYGSGFPKSHNLGDGWGTALKPAHEPIVLARKKIEGTNKQNREKYGTAGLNIDACRVGLSEGDDPRLGGKGTWKTDKMAKDVYVGGYTGVETGSSELGRFPANVMHDGLETEWARFFYCPKTSKSERNDGLDNFETKKMGMSGGAQSKGEGYDKGQGIGLNRVIERKNTHPTVKPVDLMRYLCRMVTPKGGTVLDPFMGSGSTGMAAKDEGFDFIGIEKEKEYFEICESRIKRFAPLMDFM
jgi:site-specific DNA-methyltransferase (adenine-specific)